MPERNAIHGVAPVAMHPYLTGAAGADGLGHAARAGGVPGWPVQLWGMNWRQLQVQPGPGAPRPLRWVEEAFGCPDWSAPEGAPPCLSARIVCDGALGQVGHCEIGSLHIRRGAMPPERVPGPSVYLWFIERGSLLVKLDDGKELAFGAGDLLLTDGAQPLRASWQQACVHHLSLPRQRVEEVVGQMAAAQLQGVVSLSHLGLSSFLGAQLHLLQRQGPSLVMAELTEALSVIFGTVESLLRLALCGRHERVQHDGAGDRVQAVYRFIEKNLHRHDLSAAQIAEGVNSSRAQVYRLFQGEALTVHGALREARLRKSMEYLQRVEDKQLSIGAIAYACGFSDQSVFSKLFRRRFGVTPSELRNTAARTRVNAVSRIAPIVVR